MIKKNITITVKQFEDIFNITARQQMTYRDKGGLPYYKVSKKVILYKYTDVFKWLDNRVVNR